MQVSILSAFLLLSSSLLISAVVCDPNHHHNHHNEDYTSESTVEVLKEETSDGTETPVVVQNGTRVRIVTSSNGDTSGLPLGFKIGIPIICILIFVGFWYVLCRCCHICVVDICCCGCCETERPGVVIMQSNTAQTQQPGPQIILQQPIIHQQAPPMYEPQQRWAQPPTQWNQPPQGPPQWVPQPMGQQQQYSPHGGYDNGGFNPNTAPPPYNNGKY